ncbi:unnamed protein product [Heterosigma akashiwo]
MRSSRSRSSGGGGLSLFGSSKNKKKEASTSPRKISQLFERYEDQEENPGTIGMEGISRLGEDIGIDPAADVRILVFLWKIGANENPGQVQREEFSNGLTELGVDTIEGIRSLLPQLDPNFMEHSTFREFYKFVFQFSREGTKRTIEKDIIAALLPMVVENRSPHLAKFVEFLEQLPENTRVTLDQWNSFLEFSQQVPLSLEGFDADGAWPTLLDEYVEWLQGQQSESKK